MAAAADGDDAEGSCFLHCHMPIAGTSTVVTRRVGGQAVQTLVECGTWGDECRRPLLGADTSGPLRLGPLLQLYAEPPAAGGGGGGDTAAAAAAGGGGAAGGAAAAATARQPYDGPFDCCCWDPWSAAVYGNVAQDYTAAIARLTADNTVTVVAGSVEERGDDDGAGSAARFHECGCIAADGRGRLYVAEGWNRIRQLQLPAASEVEGAAGLTATAGGAAAAGGEVVVTTLPLRAAGLIRGLACDSGSSDGDARSSLVYATSTAVYRLPLGGEGAAAAAPVLLAGREGEEGAADGRGGEARFTDASGLVLDGEGCVYVADHTDDGSTAVRQVARDGAVTTITGAGLEDYCWALAILPNGYLALCGNRHLHVLDLGLRLPPGHAGLPLPAPKPTGPPPRTLRADLGVVLRSQPDGTADVAVLAGGQTFHCHRVILASRSDFFKQLFHGGFADGSAQQVELPDAQPAVFERVLLYIYTEDVGVPPALAQGVAELADRLLLPELCAAAQAVVEAGVTPSSVVGALLWAEAAGPSFSALLGRLKGWYAEHHEEVLEQAPESIKLLASSPSLLVELMQAGTRAVKRARTS